MSNYSPMSDENKTFGQQVDGQVVKRLSYIGLFGNVFPLLVHGLIQPILRTRI